MGRRGSMPWAAAAAALLVLLGAQSSLIKAEEVPLPAWMHAAAAALAGSGSGPEAVALDPQAFVALRETVRAWDSMHGCRQAPGIGQQSATPILPTGSPHHPPPGAAGHLGVGRGGAAPAAEGRAGGVSLLRLPAQPPGPTLHMRGPSKHAPRSLID